MLERVKSLAKLENVTVLMVTHHISDALAVASDFIFVDQGNALAVERISQLNINHPNKQLTQFLSAEIER